METLDYTKPIPLKVSAEQQLEMNLQMLQFHRKYLFRDLESEEIFFLHAKSMASKANEIKGIINPIYKGFKHAK